MYSAVSPPSQTNKAADMKKPRSVAPPPSHQWFEPRSHLYLRGGEQRQEGVNFLHINQSAFGALGLDDDNPDVTSTPLMRVLSAVYAQ